MEMDTRQTPIHLLWHGEQVSGIPCQFPTVTIMKILLLVLLMTICMIQQHPQNGASVAWRGWMLIKLTLHHWWSITLSSSKSLKFEVHYYHINVFWNLTLIWSLKLQSTLLGLPCPVNSVGNLPLRYMNLNKVSCITIMSLSILHGMTMWWVGRDIVVCWFFGSIAFIFVLRLNAGLTITFMSRQKKLKLC